MEFEFDKQSVKDLEIFRDDKSSDSIFMYFNCTKTVGGKEHLKKLMNYPLTDIDTLKERSEIINYLCQSGFSMSINSQQFNSIGHYIRLNTSPLKRNFFDAFLQFASYKINPTNNYNIIKTGITNLLYLFKHLKVKLQDYSFPESLEKEFSEINTLINHKHFQKYFKYSYKLNYTGTAQIDNLFRKKHITKIQSALQTIYKIDAYISAAKTAKKNRLSFPEYVETKYPKLSLSGIYHPLLENAVPYDIELGENQNLCFLTGPNMAGKSTFLKTMGLSIYLSQLGFPVPAKKMTTSIYKGIITTINLADSLNKGYSHFYSEVKRVKETAIKLKDNERLFVIFDELFRGTNVKDAFDASLIIIESFANIRQSTFFISTHITEIAEEIKKHNNIEFKYFDSKLIDNKPVYNYKIENGVSHERLGMFIVKNEGILEILNSINEN
jgi:DNA mismatch repair protein MutS